MCQSQRERLLQLESIFALGISITGLQSSASLIMDSHMALLTHAVLRFSLPILPCFSFLGVLLSSLVSSHSISLFPIFCPPLATSNVDTFCSFFFFFLTNILSLGHPLNPGYDPPYRAVTQVTMAAEPGIPTLCPARFQTSDRKQ